MTLESVPSGVTAYAFRLTPGVDLKRELLAFAARHHLKAAAVVTCPENSVPAGTMIRPSTSMGWERVAVNGSPPRLRRVSMDSSTRT